MSDLVISFLRAAPRSARRLRLGTIRWYVRDAARSALWWCAREPLPGFVGWFFVAAGWAAWVIAYTCLAPGLLSGLCVVEGNCLETSGVLAIIISQIIKWFRDW